MSKLWLVITRVCTFLRVQLKRQVHESNHRVVLVSRARVSSEAARVHCSRAPHELESSARVPSTLRPRAHSYQWLINACTSCTCHCNSNRLSAGVDYEGYIWVITRFSYIATIQPEESDYWNRVTESGESGYLGFGGEGGLASLPSRKRTDVINSDGQALFAVLTPS